MDAPESLPDPDGAWDGTIALGASRLRCVFHIRSLPTGLAATLDSVDQGTTGIPVAAVTRAGDALRFDIAAIAAVYEGRLSGRDTIDGIWRQAGHAIPLVFTRRAPGAADPVLKRTQTPVAPVPYREEEVAFASSDVRIAGTLTCPAGPGPFPAALLIAGSGPLDRNGTAFGHHVLWVLADHLTRSGLAVLRCDKRGVGKSTGDFSRATSVDFAADAHAAVAFLAGRPEIDGARIGLIGHSEGGLIAPMVSMRPPVPAFVVLLAAPAVPGERILLSQAQLIARSMGASEETIAANVALMRRLYAAVSRAQDAAQAEAAAREVLAASPDADDATLDARARAASTDWFRFFLTYDPAPALRGLTAPLLVLVGEKDLQVAPAENLPVLRQALAAHPDHEIREIPGANHLFQNAATGSIAEYAHIEETMAPGVLALISGWIAERVQARPPRG